MHVCENNCALTLEDEIKFWGLDDALLQVAAIFVSSVYLFEIKFWGLDDALPQLMATREICNMLCLLCLSADDYLFLQLF